MTHTEAINTLATARSQAAGKPLANNTRLYDRGTHSAIRLHDTDKEEKDGEAISDR